MSGSDTTPDDAPKKVSKLPILFGFVLMLALGGGGFFAVYSGLILGHGAAVKKGSPHVEALPDIAFVPIAPMVVSLGSESGRYLHFTAQIEVAKVHESDVVLLLPRVLDVLNGYLRAVEVSELEDPTALVRLRAQMLRRVQMVAGDGRVRDLLVTEFVIN
ncbi:flagellar basal body-associated FliL family protein [Defluviimonas sp. CAU 1641]|uniref:Flagellar protein FliL n=2 Tax=Defluviimonas salinarum TaxID=2992147 RepID=A0ABT3J2Z7_9RHOB|nr:flagellar basal body-associated FliL family protein [Defluviimonas salinarum]MCW3782043.1 flagellar basal body-associated FliL family protein [Defluviimonas salinarum]